MDGTTSEQPLFADMPPVVESAAGVPTRRSQARVRRPVRNQIEWAPRDLDASLAQDHVARVIWAYLEQVDLEDFYAAVESIAGEAGRPATDPQVLLALWLLATAEGVGSARRLARLCDEHDAYRWLRGGVPINYHMLADFRVEHRQALNELLTKILATLLQQGLVTLTRVAQDGLRVRANAGAASFRGRTTLAACLAEAEAQVERLSHALQSADQPLTRRQRTAQERAANERLARIKRAIATLPEVEAVKQRQRYTLDQPRRERVREPRVSTTDPEARVMRMPDGGFRPAYNVQLATDAPSQVIVGVSISTRGTDQGEALPMAREVVQRTRRQPGEYLVDGGYVKRDDVTSLERAGTTVYAPLRPPRTVTSGRDASTPRADDSAEVRAWRARMDSAAGQAIYRQRGATAECVNAHARRHGVLQFGVRGIDKVLSVMLLVAITHNLLRWMVLDR